MRVELLFLFCLACLAFTAQAAPTSATEALRVPRHKERSNHDKHDKHEDSKHGHHHHRHESHREKETSHSSHAASRLKNRAEIPGEVAAAKGAAERLLPQPQPELYSSLSDQVAEQERLIRQRKTLKEQHVQVEDAIHVARYGKEPPKFPEITRAAAAIGLTAALLNVANFLFSAKTTALATTQFSTPPTPPTLIDTAALWDGKQYRLMPLPEGKSAAIAAAGKVKRSLVQESINRQLRKRHLVAKRWIVSTLVGTALGAALAPGFTSEIRGKKAEVDKPPFDPYDPNMLKPHDSFSAAAASVDQPLPAVPASALTGGSAPGTPPNVDSIRFPVQASYLPVSADPRTQPLVNPGSSYVASSSRTSASSEAQPVLRKRSVVAASHSSDGDSDGGSSSELDKRFLFGGGGVSGKLMGAATLGSVLPLLYKGVTHARWRTSNPRDRDILKELDDTPTYGAVGVPGHQPGQLATNAMPGYTDYVSQLEQQQARAQRAADTQAASLAGTPEAATSAAATGTAGGGGGDPVLRRRADHSHLEKRGWLLGGSLTVLGGLLGYAQSATQFPTDRDEEKDKKKREARKKQEEMMAAQQQQAGYPGAAGAGAGAGAGADPLAGIPERPLPGTMGGGGLSDGSAYGATTGGGGGGGYAPAAGSGSGMYSPTTYGGSGYGSSSSSSLYSTDGASTGGTGGGSSLGASLNAAAGYGASSSAGSGGGGGSVLKKRSPSSAAAEHELEKRTPGFGSALTIGGTAMFGGTLLANLWVSGKQRSKPVPVVTPNADTRGPMIPGGDLYAQYLASKRIQPGSAGGTGLAGGGAPAAVNYGASMPAAVNTASAPDESSAAVVPGTGPSSDASDSAATGGLDPVLKKRDTQPGLQKRSPEAPLIELESQVPNLLKAAGAASGLARGAAASEAGVGAASMLGRGGAAASEAGAGAFSRVSAVGREGGGFARLSESARPGLSRYGGTTAAEGGLSSFERTPLSSNPFETSFASSFYRPGGTALSGAARPAMVSDFKVATGTAGAPATIEGAAAAEAEAGADAAAAATGKRKGMTPLKMVSAVGSGAGVTMMMNGLG
ncbi:conserved hypothetical protein [Sporisorium reilianum SRZ2]|uniref:Uncharacterized protein n=1 Tax=Sporisorium reilianum (strain SRZ2) TaxID=999809 RepID=E6ZPK3_SPORE|nr:conserved hypothetical protein [Sporisorium reilianum SRZ2]